MTSFPCCLVLLFFLLSAAGPALARDKTISDAPTWYTYALRLP